MQNDLKRFQNIVNVLLESEKNQPVPEPVPAANLLEILDLSLSEDPISDESLESLLTDLVRKTPKTASKLFFNQLFGGRNSKAVLGDLLAVMLNNSMYTYKVAGPMVGIEKVLLRKVVDIIGYGEDAIGTIATGGSMTNFMAMNMARDVVAPNANLEGMNQSLTAYTSVESHYSIPKNAAFLGVGRNNVRYIPTNDRGEMIPEKLVEAIEKDLVNSKSPFFVNATAGTTVYGAFDPINALADICERYKIWLHVDGAYCGSVIFSNQYKYLVKGLERTNSFSMNAHKMIGTPLTCSIIITQHKKHLYESYSNDAEYLYQTGSDDLNLGKISFQCGRRNDALKFWTLWKSVGTTGLAKIVDKQFELGDFARSYIQQNPDYQVYGIDNSISVCFNYKGIPAKKLCTLLYEHAEIMVGFGQHKETEFIRFVTINYGNSPKDILNFFKRLEAFVEENANLVGIREAATVDA